MDKALVAVSGGSDSLALLDMLYKSNQYNLIVCHVNYNYRESALRDQNIVVDFCEQRKIKCYVLTLDSRKQKEGNFEDWARVQRYKFFKKIYDKENCLCLFVGHQKDDVLETYLIQNQRNAIVENYGLKKENIIQGMKVIRPLLNYTKEELENYCLDNNILYGVDETNFDLNYSRNKIRHQVIDKMSNDEKNNMFEEIQIKNVEREKHVSKIKTLKKECSINLNIIDLEKFMKLNQEDKVEVLYYFLIDNLYKKISIKKGRLLDILKKIDSKKPNIELAKYDDFILYKEYKLLVIEENKKEYCYEIELDKQLQKESGFYRSDNGKKLERIIVSKDHFPLYLKNYDGSNQKINRIFIDKKIPLRERKTWPVVVDKFGVLLLVINIKKFYNEVCDLNGDIIDFYIRKNEGE